MRQRATQRSGGAAQSSGGVSLTKMDIVWIINKRKPIPESDLRKAFEWKPWEARREEVPRKRPVPSSNEYEDHMKSQADILRRHRKLCLKQKTKTFTEYTQSTLKRCIWNSMKTIE
jgi:hypothetical protein